jgi:hypothetical protein
MRIAWATPFNQKSAIGSNFSLPIAYELIRCGHQIDIVRTEIGSAMKLPALQIEAPIYSPGVFLDRLPKRFFDAMIVNWGNDFQFHGGALELIAVVPTMAIFHDAEMHDFAVAAAYLYKSSHTDFAMPLPAEYPIDGLDKDRAEVLAWFASLASGAVVHERQYLSLVQGACPGPVHLVSLGIPIPVSLNGSPSNLPTVGRMTTEVQPHFAKAYVEVLLTLIHEAIRRRPVIDVGLQFGAILDACSAKYDEPAIARIGAVIDELFGSTNILSDINL